MKVTIVDENKSTINSPDIPIGFFKGKIGTYKGLFFRSRSSITFLPGSAETDWHKPIRTELGDNRDTVIVEEYLPVDVEIKVCY